MMAAGAIAADGMAANSTEPVIAAECRAAVHLANLGAEGDLVWDTTARCDPKVLPNGAWVAVKFAYPLPAGSTFLDPRADVRPIERDGRIAGVAVAPRALDPWTSLRFSIRTRNEGRGTSAKLTPPLLDGDLPQIVAFGNAELTFEPRASLDPRSRASAMAITLGDFSHAAYRDALKEGRALGARWDGPAVVLRATRAIRDEQGIEGELAPRADKTRGVYIGVGLLSLATAVGLGLVAIRFKRRSDDEHAEAVLRAEIDSL
ncbi:hypothetical protein [Pendulispora albinea]|uniref:Uncharacterized protein n=1 Tax=Pendulispora albinea TaxID=2741071 RepID=A0ABZ2LSW8_9BACT